MEMMRVYLLVLIAAFVFSLLLPSINAHGGHVHAPASAPTGDGVAIDQGIAYTLMLVALALTYLIH